MNSVMCNKNIKLKLEYIDKFIEFARENVTLNTAMLINKYGRGNVTVRGPRPLYGFQVQFLKTACDYLQGDMYMYNADKADAFKKALIERDAFIPETKRVRK